jgi:hypothetical protein
MSEMVGSRGVVRRTALLVAIMSVGAASAAVAQKASTTDPRVGLKPGLTDAGEAIKNLSLVSHSPRPTALSNADLTGLTFANSDLAFKGNYVYQGNFSGFSIWNIANPGKPALVDATVCVTGQGDPSIFGNLLFISSEGVANRLDCANTGVKDTVSKERSRGVRIFDVSDPAHPKRITDVQTCRGSHTHTIMQDPKDKANIYIFVSGSAGVRSSSELAGCSDMAPEKDPNGEQFRIEVIQVPLAHPEKAHVVNKPNILGGLQVAPKNAPRTKVDSVDAVAAAAAAAAAGERGGRGGRGARPPRAPSGPVQCHDITLYPAIGLGGGACGGYGVLLDVSNPTQPKRIDFAADSNFAFWHSATFNNDGTKVIFTDEWGGGTHAKCRASDPLNWGGDAIFTIKNRKLSPGAYFKMPAAQTEQENCVAHNGSLVPVPGRDIMVQGWYQGGIDVFDFTDANHPVEIAYFDRGPIDAKRMYTGGDWAAYYYNGHIIASEIIRGLDIFTLKPSDFLTQNEIDAAASVKFDTFNPQDQPKIVWPATFSLPRAYLDQLARDKGLAADKIAAARSSLDAAEKASGAQRASALTKAATALEAGAASAGDAKRVHLAVAAMRDLAKA